MGGGNSSRGQQQQSLGTLSLAPIGAAQAFGLPTGAAQGGGLTIQGGGQILPQGLFGPSTFEPLRDLARPFESFLGGDTFNQLGGQASELLQGVLPGIQQLAETGFADEIGGLAKFLFENDIAPALEEQFGAQLGLDTGDTDLRAALIREGQRTSLEAADRATQNRILGLQLAGQAPLAVAESAAGTEQLLQQGARQATPAGQLFDLFSTLTGFDTQAGGVGTGSNRSKGFNIL